MFEALDNLQTYGHVLRNENNGDDYDSPCNRELRIVSRQPFKMLCDEPFLKFFNTLSFLL